MIYTAINLPTYLIKLATRERVVPADEDAREYWTVKPAGELPWFITAGQTISNKIRGVPNESQDLHETKSQTSSRDDFANSDDRSHNSDVIVQIDAPASRQSHHNKAFQN